MIGRPLNIAVFSDSALPILNGVSVSIDQTVNRLRQLGHSVHLFTAAFPGHIEQDPNTHRFFALNTPFARDYPLALPPFYPMLWEFRRHRFDVIHTHTPFTIGMVGLRWAESHNLPIVATYHTHYDKYTHYIPIFPKPYLKYKIAKHLNFYYNNVNHIITPSAASEHWLMRHSVRQEVTVIPTGIPVPQAIDRDQVRREFGVAPDQQVVLYAGRIAVEKNLGFLLEAMKTVLKQNPRAVLWVVGDGPAREEFRRKTSDLGIGDRVKFFGFIPREDVDRFYAAADLFVFASRTETQGLVVSEAMSYGLPAVVVNSGGAAEAVKDGYNGYAVPNNVELFAQSVLYALEDPVKYRAMSEAAVESAKKLSVPAMADRIVDVYRNVLGEPAPAGRTSYVK